MATSCGCGCACEPSTFFKWLLHLLLWFTTTSKFILNNTRALPPQKKKTCHVLCVQFAFFCLSSSIQIFKNTKKTLGVVLIHVVSAMKKHHQGKVTTSRVQKLQDNAEDTSSKTQLQPGCDLYLWEKAPYAPSWESQGTHPMPPPPLGNYPALWSPTLCLNNPRKI